MKRHLVLAIAVGAVALAVLVGFAIANPYLDARADRMFGKAAQLEYASLEESHNTYHKLRFPETSMVTVPVNRPTTVEEWSQRYAAVDTSAHQAALRLHTSQKRELALRWLDLRRSMRTARIGYIDLRIDWRWKEELCVTGANVSYPSQSRERTDFILICWQDEWKARDRQEQALDTQLFFPPPINS